MALPFISRPCLMDVLCRMQNVISSSARYAFEKLSLILIQRENEMNLIRRMFALFCDEPVSENGDDGAKNETPSESKPVDLGKPLSEEQFAALSEEDQQTFFEKSLDRKNETAKPKEEENDEASDDEDDAADDEDDKETTDEDDTDLDVDEDDETPASEETVEDEDKDDDEDSETPDVTKKRLTDTQKAFRAARAEAAELKKRIDELEKKATPAPAAEKKDEEITLATIKPEVLSKAMKDHPVETLRWIADQQVKQTLKANEEANKKANAEVERANRMKASEDATIKQFPVLQEILAMSPEELASLKETQKVKYLFGKKTARYFKEFQARGDEDAFRNAAARAYVELSPSMIKDIQRETKRLAEKELVNKKRILGKVSTTGNKGAIGGKGTPKHKSLSDDDFMKLTPSQQMEYWDKSVDSKSAKRSR